MGILLGLLTALNWGGSDFLARFATQRIGTLRTMFYMQATGFLLLTICLPWLGGWGHLAPSSGWHPWAWGLLAGCINGISTLTLYRSFEIGKMVVVAPLSASYPALTVTLSLLTGERLTAARATGIVLTVLGVILVAAGETPPSGNDAEATRRSGKGLGLAFCSAVGFGVLFWLLGIRVVPRVGAAQTVWLIRMTCVVLAGAVILFAKQPMRLPRDKSRWMVWSMGFLDTSAFVSSNCAVQIEQVAVVSVLGALYGAVTVALAAIFLKEHVSRWQWLGIVTIFAGIVLISR
jgi:drug/metabolite transporter (DMT)-like permease